MNSTGVSPPELSVLIVSYNTREVLAECLHRLASEADGISHEVIVVDNCSRDGSPEMIAAQFPYVRLIVSEKNLGFAAANNLALTRASGRYTLLLNSDAFLTPGSLRRAMELMVADPRVGLGGARLVGKDGSWQPSARMFPSPLNDVLVLSGLANKFPNSRFFGRADRTWADQTVTADVNWVPGAFCLIRSELIAGIGLFDEAFFLYYEEVDLCRRIWNAGYKVRYWADVEVIHLGGESSRSVGHLEMSSKGRQLTLWRMRSALLYYRKHHGESAWIIKQTEFLWHGIRSIKNYGTEKAAESRSVMHLMEQAWEETQAGRVSPPRPW